MKNCPAINTLDLGYRINYSRRIVGMINMNMHQTTLMIPAFITFSCGISINTQTGEVTIPDGISLSDASKAFWTALHTTFPGMNWNQP
jgi:hypothetical protein